MYWEGQNGKKAWDKSYGGIILVIVINEVSAVKRLVTFLIQPNEACIIAVVHVHSFAGQAPLPPMLMSFISRF
jgi:hypothetical protein